MDHSKDPITGDKHCNNSRDQCSSNKDSRLLDMKRKIVVRTSIPVKLTETMASKKNS